MFEFLLATTQAPFTIALVILFILLIFELVMLTLGGLNLDSILPDFHVDVDVDSAMGIISSWTLLGKVPIIIMISILLCGFSASGLILQSLVNNFTGSPLPLWIAVVITLPCTLLFTRFAGGFLARLFPKDESYVVSKTQFIGQVAIINQGVAKYNLPAEAKLKDGYQKTHYVRVKPEHPGEEFPVDTQVLLLRDDDGVYVATRASYDVNV